MIKVRILGESIYYAKVEHKSIKVKAKTLNNNKGFDYFPLQKPLWEKMKLFPKEVLDHYKKFVDEFIDTEGVKHEHLDVSPYRISLEKNVNKFLEALKENQFIDIKYNNISTEEGYSEPTAMIIYRKWF